MSITSILNAPQIEDNLSGYTLASLLDTLLFQACDPLLYTNVLDRGLASILRQTELYKKRKITHNSRQDCYDMLFNFLASNDLGSRRSLLRGFGLERNLLLDMLQAFLRDGAEYQAAFLRYCAGQADGLDVMTMLEKRYDCDRRFMGAIIDNARFFVDMYVSFRAMILAKYYRYAWQEAGKHAAISSTHINVEDLFVNLVLGVSKALDKYSPDKGALTSYINWWFRHVKNNPEFSHVESQAYDAPTAIRNDREAGLSFAYPLDMADDEQAEPQPDPPLDAVSHNLPFAGPESYRIPRLVLNLRFTLTDAERRALAE